MAQGAREEHAGLSRSGGATSWVLHVVAYATWHISCALLACIVQAQLLHSKAVACCRMRLLMQPGTFHSAYAGLHRASAASSQQCCGMLSHAVAQATWHIHSAYAGLHRASAASSQQGCGMLSHAVAYATWHIS